MVVCQAPVIKLAAERQKRQLQNEEIKKAVFDQNIQLTKQR